VDRIIINQINELEQVHLCNVRVIRNDLQYSNNQRNLLSFVANHNGYGIINEIDLEKMELILSKYYSNK